MRAFTRIVTAGFFVLTVVLTAVPASAATPDGWCLNPGTDICRRY
ncbi:hypothetical protein ACIA5G_37415 [Amycolatopsis sp. NPDC051758]